ncbi:MAG: tRNA (adenosine(37)-N6)-threonylcarbamoyltransferase complex ATPase subunit type 1 TsaE [Pseudomonadales bacterium]|jgi:tRNA threonylcarbamoyladenosine biosynthesis protein TsaE|nr:tRNA (adenosine(37)-N6)-threonylcarbamoyltransferase complex ATPase subunit type 1 TsaE [Pseudomonadales bacterium]
MTDPRVVELDGPDATERLGAALCDQGPGAVIFLRGELGAGKTTLVRGFLRAAGHLGPVRSPTYTLVESYECGVGRVHHFDLYRLLDPEELEDIGGREYFGSDAWCFVEWPERGLGHLPTPDLEIRIEVTGAGRRATLQSAAASGARWRALGAAAE